MTYVWLKNCESNVATPSSVEFSVIKICGGSIMYAGAVMRPNMLLIMLWHPATYIRIFPRLLYGIPCLIGLCCSRALFLVLFFLSFFLLYCICSLHNAPQPHYLVLLLETWEARAERRKGRRWLRQRLLSMLRVIWPNEALWWRRMEAALAFALACAEYLLDWGILWSSATSRRHFTLFSLRWRLLMACEEWIIKEILTKVEGQWPPVYKGHHVFE